MEPLHAETAAEEAASCATHGIGAVLSVAGLAGLLVAARAGGDARRVVSLAVYGGTLVLLYTSSMLYHLVRPGRCKQVMRVVDHAAVFLLIAGTYTPFALVVLKGTLGWTIWGVEWALAAVGVGLKVLSVDRFVVVSLLVQLAMGWLAVVAAGPLFAIVSWGGVWLLVGGGVAYSAGVAFYLWDELPFNHAIWHVFVLTGSVCHFAAVVRYVV